MSNLCLFHGIDYCSKDGHIGTFLNIYIYTYIIYYVAGILPMPVCLYVDWSIGINIFLDLFSC